MDRGIGTGINFGFNSVSGWASYGLFYHYKEKARQELEDRAVIQNRRKESKRKTRATDTCPICLDELLNHCFYFKCDHSYHKKCIVAWNKINKTCPVCRSPFKAD